MSALEKNILATLCWFDIYKYPLTRVEIWQYLWRANDLAPVTLLEVAEALRALANQNKIQERNGFWQLSSTADDLLKIRQSKFVNSINKRRLAQWGAKIIAHLPYIKMVALGNTLAFDNASTESDIDLLIVTEPKKLFTARFLVTLVIQLLGWRRHGQKINNRLCLSFYLTSDNLDFQKLSYNFDPYLVYWLATLNVLYDAGLYYEKLLQINAWLDKYLIHWRQTRFLPTDLADKNLASEAISVSETPALEAVGLIEKFFKKIQIWKINSHKVTRLNDGTKAVIVGDKILKFHESDARPALANKFLEKMISLNIN